MTDPTRAAALLHEELRRATSRLLGDTIALADEDWRGPSRLPGWSRGHVATHLARQADAVARVVGGVLDDHPAQMYDSAEARDREIEEGADRDGQELQNDLDSSAAALDALFARADEHNAWDGVVTLRDGSRAPAGTLPLARLAEVVLHHVDLDIGFTLADLPGDTANTLLAAAARRMAPRFDVPIRLLATDAAADPEQAEPALPTLGPGRAADPTEVSGTTIELLGWLSGRGSAVPSGAADITVPAY